jgi:alpha-L-arabinofuranosidase
MLQRVLVVVTAATAVAGAAGAQTIDATIVASQRGSPIQPQLYGMFIEHIGNLLESGFRAEMLDDRKFYFPVTASSAPAPGGRRRAALRRWQPLGPETAVRMDSAHAYAADHAPAVTVTGAGRRGIQQTGLAVRAGTGYTGRIVVSADGDVTVSVALVWGPAARQTVGLEAVGPEYATRHFTFTAGATTDSARLEITGTGTGTFRVGAVSLMPADNVEGYRREVITALAQLHSGVYRFPGGNFVSGYEWRDAVGDPDRRPPRWDPVWSAVQPNDMGLDEFMVLCRLLDVEPHVAVNGGFGDAWSAAQEVEYANGDVTTPMGRLRAANGHPEPYHVRYWAIGNEMWGHWQLGYMSLDQWILKHNQFARAMKRVDPSIVLIGSGAMPDAMTGSGEARRLTGKVVPEYLGPADWSGRLLAGALANVDLLSEHFYVYAGTHFDLERGEQVPNDPNEPLVDWMRRPANMVRAKYEHYQEYLKRIPALRDKRVPISLDEWAYAGVDPNSFKPVPAYAWALDEMFRHSDLFTMGGFTFAGSTLAASRTDAVLNPVGLLFRLYRERFGTIPVAVSGTSPQPAPKGPPGGEQPHVNAGSDTYPLDVAAALTADGKTLTVAVVNPTPEALQLRLHVRDMTVAGAARAYRMAPGRLDAVNLVGQPAQVGVEELAASVSRTLEVPAMSVAIYVFPVR